MTLMKESQGGRGLKSSYILLGPLGPLEMPLSVCDANEKVVMGGLEVLRTC